MDDPNMHAYDDAQPYRCIKPQCSNHCDGCNCAISQADDAAMLVVDLLNAFGVDGHGGPLEDGESALVDRARAWLAARPQVNADAEVGARWRNNSSLEEWFPITAEKLKPLTKAQLSDVARTAQIAFCLKSGGSFEEEFARAVERAHGVGT